MDGRGHCWCSEGPSTAHGREVPGCEKWGPETMWTSSQTVFLKVEGGEEVVLSGQVTDRQADATTERSLAELSKQLA